ncbi:hypothetical protein [uncultured Sphingomonas sp.]|uniref:head-tail connector protein n=1 Tax=uncultured Sphingomonas sp. TaxID=158754 RepID=UPI0025F42CE1|nr:hypothetical protein [uncultured Sphingomonas sp.]
MEEADRAAAVAAVKDLLRVGSTAEDGLLGALVGEAFDLAERFTGQVLIERVVNERIAADGNWRRVTATPVRAISGVSAQGVALSADAFAVDIDGDGDGWVRVSGAPRVVSVALTAGLAGAWDELPSAIQGGIVRLAAFRFDARDGGEAAPAAVSALWRPYRRLRLIEGRQA